MVPSPFPSPAADLSATLGALRRVVGDLGARFGLSQMLLLLVYRRIGQIGGRLERLVARYRAGTLRRVGPRAAVTAPDAVRVRRRPEMVLPRRFGWLQGAMGWRVAGYRLQLETVLRQPEMEALLVAAPQAARMLMPLCRMLGMDLRYLQPGVAVVAVPEVAAEPRKARVRKPAVPTQIGRVAWPRGVLAWARREGFGKIPPD